MKFYTTAISVCITIFQFYAWSGHYFDLCNLQCFRGQYHQHELWSCYWLALIWKTICCMLL